MSKTFQPSAKLFQYIFISSIFVILFFLFKWSGEVGLDGDTPIQVQLGKACYNYFSTGGKDTTYKDVVAYKTKIHNPHITYYGAGVEATAIAVANFTGNTDIGQLIGLDG